MLTWLYAFATPRELAIILWTIASLLFALSLRSVRKQLAGILKRLSSWKLWLPLAIYAAYIGAIVYLLSEVNLWTQALLGATIIWFLASGVTLVGRTVTQAAQESGFFRHRIIDLFRITVLLEFVINIKSFSLWAELLILPALTILTWCRLVAFHKNEKSLTGRVITGVLAGVTLILLIVTMADLFQPPYEEPTGLLRDFLLPIVLGLASLPFAYLFAVVAGYEDLYCRIYRYGRGKQIPFRARLGLATALHGDISKIRAFSIRRSYEAAKLTSFGAARELVKDHERVAKEEETARVQARQRLVEYAGAEGVDEEGKQLDRREFMETKKALDWLHLCQSGHYRNRKKYRHDILDFLGSFADKGLADPHNIVLRVRSDGQAWFAYRSTPSGYTFGIGAVGRPYNRWLYAGSNPPADFPSENQDGWRNELNAEPLREWEEEPAR